jgi:hypothetical protein
VTNKKRSPLKSRALRVPGQSVDEKLWDVMLDNVLVPSLLALFLVLLALFEWVRFYFPNRLSPWILTAIAAAALLYCVFRVSRVWAQLKSLRQAREGERAVGQFLEQLRISGFEVLHDVLGDKFNLDHVLIGPKGVYTIETKTFSKAPHSKVKFDGEVLLVDGWVPERDPVAQARAQANWLRGLLKESTGRAFKVRPVVLFPGWFVDHSPGAHRDVWVLNPKALLKFLENEQTAIASEDVKLAAYHLGRYVRASRPIT